LIAVSSGTGSCLAVFPIEQRPLIGARVTKSVEWSSHLNSPRYIFMTTDQASVGRRWEPCKGNLTRDDIFRQFRPRIILDLECTYLETLFSPAHFNHETSRCYSRPPGSPCGYRSGSIRRSSYRTAAGRESTPAETSSSGKQYV
jgi:hypothetical protein